MSESLGNFLVDLACSPDLMAQFLGDPAAVIAHSALSDQERILVLTRNSRRLADALGTTGYALGQIVDGISPRKAPRKKTPARKKKAPARKKAPAKKVPKKPARKAPAGPTRKKR